MKSKTIFLRIVSFATVIVMLSACFMVSCKKKTDSTDGLETNIKIDISQYKIVHAKVSSDRVTAAAAQLKEGLSANLEVFDDSYAASDVSVKEILVGITDREESAAILSEIPENSYGIAIRGNKILIAARKDSLLREAVTYFLNHCGNKTEVEFSSEYLYLSDSYSFIDIVTGGKSNYTVVRGETASEYTVTLTTKIREAINLASSVRNIGLEVDSYGDVNERTRREIVVGETNRAVSKEAVADLPADGFCIELIGNSVVLNAHSLYGVEQAVNEFISLINANVNTDKSITIPVINSISNTVAGILENIPAPSGLDVLSGYKGMGNRFESVYKNAVVSDYTAYLAKLSSSGYTKYDDNIIGSNNFSTYIKGNAAVYISFHTFDSTLRVTAETFTALPDTTAEAYTSITDTKLTQIGLVGAEEKNGIIYSNSGMGYVFTLEDGSYVIIDGGGKYGEDEDTLYDFLNENNERTDGKIVIAAWLFTHDDDDHTGVFIKFTNTKAYYNNVTVERVAYNFPNSYEAPGDLRGEDFLTEFKNSVSKYTGVKTIIPHAGQKMIIRNIEIEFLFTHEFLSPYYVESSNNASTVFRVTASGQTVLFLGDAEQISKKSAKNIVDLIVEMYGSELKSDIMQMANHGLSGGSVALYTLVDPIMVIWPVTEKDWNTAAGYESSAFVIQWETDKKIIIVKGYKTTSIILPYAPIEAINSAPTGDDLEIDFNSLEWND